GLGGGGSPVAAAPAPAQKQAAPAPSQQRTAQAPVRQQAPVVVALPSTNPDGDYEIKAGDTLSKIADEQKVEGGWQKLVELNKSFIPNADLILPGQKIATK
ncbi:MAG TPA: LysM domain-containing protein, partial [Umezawaea sp.]|nr:LysM domain-containing protein [Umezawaea sp.]